jgi:hypothetical protein
VRRRSQTWQTQGQRLKMMKRHVLEKWNVNQTVSSQQMKMKLQRLIEK